MRKSQLILRAIPAVLLVLVIFVSLGRERTIKIPFLPGAGFLFFAPEDSTNNNGTDTTQLPYPIEDREGDFVTDQQSNSFYLGDPEVISQNVEYDPNSGNYIIEERIGEAYYRAPSEMSFEEFLEQQNEQSKQDYWEERSNAFSLVERKGLVPKVYVTSNFFDKVFGGTTVDIRPSGNIDLTFGGNSQKIDNPSLPEQQRKQGGFDFDMNINMSVIGKIGDKLKLTTNYNTQATFDFENQIKLKYEGEEDDIIKSVEAGNVSLPLSGSLITGSQSLFGVKAKLQFGRLTMTSVVSQQKSKAENITIQNGAQTQEFEVPADQYDENRHFFLAQYFRDNYENALSNLPIINSLVTITKMEVWVSRQQGATQNLRDFVGFMDLGEPQPFSGEIQSNQNGNLPGNNKNNLYGRLQADANNTRSIDNVVSTLEGTNFSLQAVQDFEKKFARKLSASEYTFHPQLGYISLNQALYADDVLAVSYEYTHNGERFQVGDFAQDFPPDSTDGSEVLFLKLLKSSAVNTDIPLWDLMMKNIYSLGAYQVQQEEFQLDVYYQDPGGGVKRYIPEGALRGKPLIRVLELDNLNSQGDPQPDGIFDYVTRVTINPNNGRVIFPVLEPFGDHLRDQFTNQNTADKYVYDQLYDSTKVVAQQFPEFNRFLIKGKYQASSTSDISLGAFNIPQGSVKVTAGGQQLTEGSDYSVDYSLGRIKILNQGVLNSGVPINVSFENNALFGFQTKSLYGTRLDYWVNDNFTMGGTVMKLTERPFTEKVNVGDDPISNSIYGYDFNYQTESQGLTWLVDKLPFYETKEKSQITINGEMARLRPGHSKAIGDQGTVYIDDFEGTRSSYDLKFPAISWQLSSTPRDSRDKVGTELFPEAKLTDQHEYGYNRARLAWYNIDPLFYNSNAQPEYIKDNPDFISDHYVREVSQLEVFPNRDIDRQQTTSILQTFDLAFYPDERGAYNYEHSETSTPYSAGVNTDGSLKDPNSRWGGIMRSIDNNDFEAANIEFIEFWVMDPFFYDPNADGGDLYINLGNISEDVLKDSRKFFEHGLPNNLDTTNWSLVSRTQPITNAFDNDPALRGVQDVGFDGTPSSLEGHDKFRKAVLDSLSFLDQVALDEVTADVSTDDYLYYREEVFDNEQAQILDRYKQYNGPEGNSPVNDGSSTFSYASTNLPDSEDMDRDNDLNETEAYFQYRVNMRPDMEIGEEFITDKVPATKVLPNGNEETINWYQFKIPIDEYERRVGASIDFKSIRFIRMFLNGFEDDVVLRFARLDLVRNQWRRYQFSLLNPGEYVPNDNGNNTFFNVSAVNIEENSNKEPVNYVLPDGIDREINPSSTSVATFQNEQSLSVAVCNLVDGDARAVYKTLNLDLRTYKRLQLFIHAENVIGEEPLADGDVTAFIRLGSDFKENYYEYEIPLTITPDGSSDPFEVWPATNEVDISLVDLVNLKQMRTEQGGSVFHPFTIIEDGTDRRLTVVGNPDLGLAKVAMLGIRNPKESSGIDADDDGKPKCTELWFNELRVTGFEESGGWAALGRVEFQLADLGTATVSANMHTMGYGQLEQKVAERYRDNFWQYDASTNLELGKFFPQKWGVRIPFYAGISQSFSTPEYDPYQLDVPLKQLLDLMDADGKKEYKRSTQDLVSIKSYNFSNVRIVSSKKDKKPRFYDIGNFNFTYAYIETEKSDPIIESDLEQRYNGALGYNFAPQAKYIEPFKKMIKSKSKWFGLVKDMNFNFLPSNLSFNTDIERKFGELQLRTIGDEDFPIEPSYNKNFTWDRVYGFKYNPTKSISVDYSATNNARVDEPNGRIDTEAKKDTLWDNIKDFGRNTNYTHSTNVNYNVPINKIPILDWIQLRTGYNSNYNWIAGPLQRDENTGKLVPSSLGNTVSNGQNMRVNGEFNFKNLYNKANILKPYNSSNKKKGKDKEKIKQDKEKKDQEIEKTKKDIEKNKDQRDDLKAELTTLKSDEEDKTAEIDQVKARLKKNKQDRKKLRQRVKKLKKDKRKMRPPSNPAVGAFVRPLLALKRVSVSYTQNRTTSLPGYMNKTRMLGMDERWEGPGWPFIFGWQPDNDWLDDIAAKGWVTTDTNLNVPFTQSYSENLNIRGTIEPFPYMRVDLTVTKNYSTNKQQYFKQQFSDSGFEHLNPQENGSYSISFLTWKTLFGKSDAESLANLFSTFEDYRSVISGRVGTENPNSNGDFVTLDSIPVTLIDYSEGYGPYSQEVLIPAFIAAYSGKDPNSVKLNPFHNIPIPNWRFTYNGISKMDWAKDIFTNFNITHGYTSTLTVNSFATELEYTGGGGYFNGSGKDTIEGNFQPLYNIPQVVISEQLAPLIGIDVSMKNNLTFKFDFKKSRNLSMSFIDYQLSETRTTEYVAGLGYKVKGLPLPFKFRGKKIRLENDLNFKFDFSYRDNKTLNHKLDQNITEPTSGMKSIRISPSIDYVVSNRLNLKLFFDRNRTIPAISTSFPITNTQAGITIRFSLSE